MSKPFLTTFSVVTPPSAEPVSTDLVKAYCRIYTDFDVDNQVLAGLITTARLMVERYLGRVLMQQSLKWTVQLLHVPPGQIVYSGLTGYPNYMPSGGIATTTFELPCSPVVSLTSVKLRDYNGSDIVLTSDQYSIDLEQEPARLDILWSQVNQLAVAPVYPLQHFQIEFTGGYADTNSIPMPIKQAILLYINYLYENRGDAVDTPDVPKVIYSLLQPYRITFFGDTV